MFFLSFSFFLKKINLELHHRLKHSPNCYVLLLPVNDNNFFGKQVQQQLSLDRGLLNTGLFAIQSEKIMFFAVFFVKLLFFSCFHVWILLLHMENKNVLRKKIFDKACNCMMVNGSTTFSDVSGSSRKFYILFSKILRIWNPNSTHHYIVSIYRSKTEKKSWKCVFHMAVLVLMFTRSSL